MTMNNGFLSGLTSDYLNSSPSAAFSYIFGPQMQGRNQNFNKWLRGQEGDLFADYEGAVASDPSLLYTDFLQGRDPLAEFMKLAPKQRGVDFGAMSPKVKYGYGVGY